MMDYRNATNYVCDRVEELIVDGKIDYPESTVGDSILGFSKNIQQNHRQLNAFETAEQHDKSFTLYFEVQPHIANLLVNLALSEESFFDYCLEICSTNLRSDMPLPEGLRIFASAVLSGHAKRPKRRSRPRKKNWLELGLLWSLTLELVADYGLKLTRNDEGSNKHSACDAVAEALTVCGRETSYTEIKNLMVHPDKEQLRKEFVASRKMMVRWASFDPPKNALNPSSKIGWDKTVYEDVLDISSIYSSTDKKNDIDT